ncbi:hypothetical protein [Kordiimonas marina]|uniref:DUF7946 domain-containing protein n=1 Tax=Kordiimonas marina TaxID=2872312 RepID=UPI001FF244A4|nr:hypothetical protein [Kordiimonas marina]MCJ9429269.1 hypothetical protein [Kordiimonas marina]
MEFIAKFEGLEADRHRAPAYEAAESIVGIARAFTLASHTLVTGEVRKRTPYDNRLALYLRPMREGSLETVFHAIVQSPDLKAFGIAAGAGITASLFTDLIRVLFRRAVGFEQKAESRSVEQFIEDKAGNFDALQDAVEPALKMAHEVIDNGVSSISIIGDSNVAKFNRITKQYIRSHALEERFEEMDVSVGAFNVNQKTGRVFFHDLGKTVPFKIAKEAPPFTTTILAAGLEAYANALGTKPTHIRFRRVLTPDGRTKSIVIYGASRVIIQ